MANNHLKTQTQTQIKLMAGWDAPATRVYNWDIPVQNAYNWDAPLGLTEDEIDELTALIGLDATNNLIQRLNIDGPDRIAALNDIAAIFEDANPQDLYETDETDDETDDADDYEPQFYFPNQLIPDQNGIPHCVYNAPGEPDDIMWIFDDYILRKRGDIYTQERTQT